MNIRSFSAEHQPLDFSGSSPTRICGILICGGGYRYFTNAWICLRLLRDHGCTLPVQIWMWESEYQAEQSRWAGRWGATIRRAPVPRMTKRGLPPGARWQWALKPLALLDTAYRDALLLDADNFVVRDPTYLFASRAYAATGAVFWPDVGRTEASRPIWKQMRIPYRDEPEFESGQMLIDTLRHREPLELALQMNLEAEKYYQMIWGDKDTFRFAWHKYGRPFAMVPWPLQLLSLPGMPQGSPGVMCQHDFEGNRVFQHRNMAKWDLLAENASIPGFLYEKECRRYLRELRSLWTGRPTGRTLRGGNVSGALRDEQRRLERDLVKGFWLEEDRRTKPASCCQPPVSWAERRAAKPWGSEKAAPTETKDPAGPAPTLEGIVATENALTGPPPNGQLKEARWSQPPLYRELKFAPDGTLAVGANADHYWWDIERWTGEWILSFSTPEGTSATLRRDGTGGWRGKWRKSRGPDLRLLRLNHVYPETAARPRRSGWPPTAATKPTAGTLRMANHAFGIGDAVTALYAAVGAAELGYRVVYHTRYPQWLSRVSHSRVTITNEEPPRGTANLDVDYAEQLRYAGDKARWYCQFPAGRTPAASSARSASGLIAEIPYAPARPTVKSELTVCRVDFEEYVILTPFAAWESRDWPETHWRRLAHLLREAGYEIIAIGTAKDAERLGRTFSKSYAYWAIDHEPEWVMDAMLGAAAVIGVDSGMIHVAGLLGVPTICIHSHLPPEFLFSCAPSVRSVTPETGCVFCRWQEDRGFNEACGQACSALATVGPERVMEAFERVFDPGNCGERNVGQLFR